MTASPTAASPTDASPTDARLLEVDEVVVRFGGIVALDGVSFDLDQGQILGLIGPNGAGKTTLFNCLSRLYTPASGDIRFEGRSLLGRPAHRIAEIGISRTFQNLALFPRQSVLDNVRIGGHARSRSDFVSDIAASAVGAAPGTSRSRDRLATARPARSLARWHTTSRKACRSAPASASSWPGRSPRVPSCCCSTSRPGGLTHEEVAELGVLIRRLRDEQRVTVLLVEHHMNLVMSVSDKVVALDFGRKIAEGTPAAVQQNEAVIRAYLGNPHRRRAA